jgi:hypothetical protein
MSWKTEHFRSEYYKQRALDLRNQGITLNPHKTWEQLASARRMAKIEAQKEWDEFDWWLSEIEYTVHQIRHEYMRPDQEQALREFAEYYNTNEIPF